MAIFNVTEKQQKSHFFLQFFLLKTSLQKKNRKSQHSQQTSVLVLAYWRTCLLLFDYLGRATASCLVHTDLAMIFQLTSALHAG